MLVGAERVGAAGPELTGLERSVERRGSIASNVGLGIPERARKTVASELLGLMQRAAGQYGS